MNLLAFELSTTSGSLALFRDGECVATRDWTEQPRQHQMLFDSVQSLLLESELEASDIEVLAVGRGPGNYSGLRMSMAAAQAMALPGGAQVFCVDSGLALARSLPHERVAVFGDARRNHVWTGLCIGGELSAPWELVLRDDLSGWLSTRGGAESIVSPDAERLQDLCAELPGWQGHPTIPNARQVGELAMRKLAVGEPPEPPTPLYLQPPV